MKATSVRRNSWKHDWLEYAREGESFEVRDLVEAEDINFCMELAEKRRLSILRDGSNWFFLPQSKANDGGKSVLHEARSGRNYYQLLNL
jgi:hypothetical protein